MLKILKAFASLSLLVLVIVGTTIAIEYYEPTERDAAQEANNQSEMKSLDILSTERVAYYTKVLSIFTGVLSAFGLLQILFLIRADKIARASANSAIEGNKLTREIFIAERRPWLSLEVRLAEFRFEDGNAILALRWKLTNRGNSPAGAVLVEAKHVLLANNLDINTERNNFRRDAAGKAGSMKEASGRVVFPSQEAEEGIVLAIAREELARGSFETTDNTRGRIVAILLFVCANYRFMFESGNHQTVGTFVLGTIPIPEKDSIWPPILHRFGFGDYAN